MRCLSLMGIKVKVMGIKVFDEDKEKTCLRCCTIIR